MCEACGHVREGGGVVGLEGLEDGEEEVAEHTDLGRGGMIGHTVLLETLNSLFVLTMSNTAESECFRCDAQLETAMDSPYCRGCLEDGWMEEACSHNERAPDGGVEVGSELGSSTISEEVEAVVVMVTVEVGRLGWSPEHHGSVGVVTFAASA